MANELKTTRVQRKTPIVDMVWYDGDNAVEVARWLIDRGKAQVDVSFKQGALSLSIAGYRKDIPDGKSGIWLDPAGNAHREDELTSHYDKVS